MMLFLPFVFTFTFATTAATLLVPSLMLFKFLMAKASSSSHFMPLPLSILPSMAPGTSSTHNWWLHNTIMVLWVLVRVG